MDTDLFNDGPDGDEGTAFARWLAGELVVEHEGDAPLVRDKTRQLEESRERERPKSAGWDNDEDDKEPSETYQPHEPVSVEPFKPAMKDAEGAEGEDVQGDGTKERPVDVDASEDEGEEEPSHEEEDSDTGFWD
ncbi:hypothetical protein FRC06_000254 [Ceratobasidium sp. 370]|nr:hypothetical protein FRC06_000254 [Ceratobasidium sp. 370]